MPAFFQVGHDYLGDPQDSSPGRDQDRDRDGNGGKDSSWSVNKSHE